MHLELHVEYLVTYLGILYSNLSCWRGSFILVSILIFYIPFLYILKPRYGATTHAVTTYWWHIVMVMRFACFTKKKKGKNERKNMWKKRTQQAAQDSPSLSFELDGDGGAFCSNVWYPPTSRKPESQRNYDDDCSTGATPSSRDFSPLSARFSDLVLVSVGLKVHLSFRFGLVWFQFSTPRKKGKNKNGKINKTMQN